MNRASKDKKKFTPRPGRFTHDDLIDQVRIARPAGARRFGWLDASVLYRLNEMPREEYLLYCFYCHAAALDNTLQGLSDYGLSQISAALEMSRRTILAA